MNVIGSRPDGWWRDRTAAMRRLVADLERFASATGDEVSVVLDGRPRDVGGERVTVAFAPHADDELARLAGERPVDLVVVTSDGELVRRVTGAGAAVEGSGAFRRRLDGEPYPRS
jgi:predicted RNA-binding protein with PIN domain